MTFSNKNCNFAYNISNFILKRRVFYYNITYACNNACRDCISHNVKRHSKRFIVPEDLMYLDELFHVTPNDIWTISGGEPTMSKYLDSIIDYAYSISSHINMYSNGRNLSLINDCTLSKIERLLVPIYGTEQTHNLYVSSNNAYNETIESMSGIIKNDPNKLEIKLMLDNSNSISGFLNSRDWNKIKDNIHFSVSRVLNIENQQCPPNVASEASSIIRSLLKLNKVIRFYDVPFCLLDKDVKDIISTNVDCSFNFDPIVICGSIDKRYKLFPFNSPSDYNEDCKGCEHQLLCTKIMQNYFCPVVDKAVTYIDTE